MPVPNRIQRKVFTRNEGKQGPSLPYIPSGSFAKAMLIEGADANASVTGNESTVPMQLRITGLVEMPNSKTYDATGCFVGLEAWGDVSSERAIVRTRNISCLKNGKTIDMPIKGHVSFRGKNGIKGEVVMRNGKILGWAWGAGFVDGIGQEWSAPPSRLSGWVPQPLTGPAMSLKWVSVAAHRKPHRRSVTTTSNVPNSITR
ncbi:hypothetical protein ECZU23_52180 [Escherichia coli]|nr:hypothetical protein ECZU23_52180 [Escherichia coli]